jgi:signal transduction histidine kinase/CheY-like chemotaxis protein
MNSGRDSEFEKPQKITFYKNLRQRGLSRQLFLWFLLLTVIPLIVLSGFNYQSVSRNVNAAESDKLNAINASVNDFVNNWFRYRFLDLKSMATSEANAGLLSSLVRAFRTSNLACDQFVHSESWQVIVDNQGQDLITFQQTYGYYDVFLIDPQGNILFSAAGEADLGENIFLGDLSTTEFAQSCLKTLATGEVNHSDLEKYAPSQNQMASFLTSILTDSGGNSHGIIAFQIQKDVIEKIILKRTGLGKTGESYLVSRNGRIMYNPIEANDELVEIPDTYPVRTWLDNLNRTESGQSGRIFSGNSKYKGRRLKEVLGAWHSINFGGINCLVVSEVETTEAFAVIRWIALRLILLLCGTIIIVAIIATYITREMVRPISELLWGTRKIAEGNLDEAEFNTRAKHEIADLAHGFTLMLQKLRDNRLASSRHNWFSEGQNGLTEVMRGKMEITQISQVVLDFLASYLHFQTGVIYIRKHEEELRPTATYATKSILDNIPSFKIGEGIIGQAALDGEVKILTDLPVEYLKLESGTGELQLANVIIYPLLDGRDKLLGVVELAFLGKIEDHVLEYLNSVAVHMAISINSTLIHSRTNELLEESQQMSEELSRANASLQDQTGALRDSELNLQKQQENLRKANEDLEMRSNELVENQRLLRSRNHNLAESQKILEERARALELSGKYKSEFLSNMSHELRTPLNSILLLSGLLGANKQDTMTDKQIEYANTITSSGKDLLELIDEILDLAKIEAGKMTLNHEEIDLKSLLEYQRQLFSAQAAEKNLDLRVEIDDQTSMRIINDEIRLGQIIKNLLANAFKFTQKGSICIKAGSAAEKGNLKPRNRYDSPPLAISVTDTGNGISQDKLELIFQAFQQADGTTAREYGGTGLGLSICREIANMMQGEILVESVAGVGSTFCLIIPAEIVASEKLDTGIKKQPDLTDNPEELSALRSIFVKADMETKNEADVQKNSSTDQAEVQGRKSMFVPTDQLDKEDLKFDQDGIVDDRRKTKPGDRSVLIIEDDHDSALILASLVRTLGFKILISEDGETGLYMADFYKPMAVLLDVGLPRMGGISVLHALKENLDTRHIPVFVLSGLDKRQESLYSGAVGFLAKPVDLNFLKQSLQRIENFIEYKTRQLLIVNNDSCSAVAISELLDFDNLETRIVGDAENALKIMEEISFDCLILDLGLADDTAFELLENIRSRAVFSDLPVIIMAENNLSSKQRVLLDRLCGKIIYKGPKAADKLVDETALFLHQLQADLPEAKQKLICKLHDKEKIFKSKSILVVDDDLRNVYSLGSILEEKDIKVIDAANGQEALDKIRQNKNIDLILMDMMMPKMDGYQAMKNIRQEAKFDDLPIIALTAKAMRGDRAKCIQAGANDYLAKPVDSAKLLSMLRVWLY